jgi:cation transport regulator ChaB
MGIHLVKGLNPLLQYVADLMSVFQIKPIAEPQKYRDKVLAAKDVLKHDISGLVNTTLDYAITMASSVNYRVDTNDPELGDYLNGWLASINEELRGRVPTGIESLAKEYFRERWKGSSHLLLRTAWTKKDDLYMPTTMFFIDGEDIIVKNANDETIRLGDEQYSLRLSEKEDMKLPVNKDEMIYVQTPFDAWGTREPRPFLIRRGLWHNLVFMRLLSEKGEFVVARALEYLFLIKKGTEKMFIDGNVSYSREDLEKVSKDFQELLAKKKYEIPVINGLPTGAPTYATQFDTTMEHLIPDYSKIINNDLFSTIERRLLSGLGLIDLIGGNAEKKGSLNYKPFMSEVKQGVADFQTLLRDLMKDILEKNKRKKWKAERLKITCSPIPDFLSEEGKTLVRSMYDRGLLSKRTTVEVLGDLDYDNERQRREDEDAEGDTATMYPPIIQSQEQATGVSGDPNKVQNPSDKDNPNPDKVSPDKKGPEKKNYKKSSLDEGEVFVQTEKPFEKPTMAPEIKLEVIPIAGEPKKCPKCQTILDKAGRCSKCLNKETSLPGTNFTRDEAPTANLPPESIASYEDAPYHKNKDLPPAVKKLPASQQTAFRKAWMNAYKTYKDEATAFKVAWSVVNKMKGGKE